MRPGRAAWIALNTISYFCSFLFIAFTISSQISSQWIVYDVGLAEPDYTFNEMTRTRGIWKQCVHEQQIHTQFENVCEYLEPFFSHEKFNSDVQTILSMRVTVVALQIIITILVGLTVILSCVLIITTWRMPDQFRPRTAQYTALISGSFLWLLALSYFCSLVIYYEDLSEENYRYDPKLTSARSAWSDVIRAETNCMPGGMVILVWCGCCLLYIASFLQLGASALQEPPILVVPSTSSEY